MIFSGLRPLAKVILVTSTSEGPVLFFQRNLPCVFVKHIDAHQQVTVAIVKFFLLVNTAHDNLVSLEMTTYGFMESVRVLFHSLIFVWLMLNFPPFFLHPHTNDQRHQIYCITIHCIRLNNCLWCKHVMERYHQHLVDKQFEQRRLFNLRLDTLSCGNKYNT